MSKKTSAQEARDLVKYQLSDFELKEMQARVQIAQGAGYIANVVEGNTALFNVNSGFFTRITGQAFAKLLKALATLLQSAQQEYGAQLLISKGFKSDESASIDIITGRITPNESPKAAR